MPGCAVLRASHRHRLGWLVSWFNMSFLQKMHTEQKLFDRNLLRVCKAKGPPRSLSWHMKNTQIADCKWDATCFLHEKQWLWNTLGESDRRPPTTAAADIESAVMCVLDVPSCGVLYVERIEAESVSIGPCMHHRMKSKLDWFCYIQH